MANTIGFGQGAVNNTIGYGQGAKVGSSSFSNTQSTEYDGIDDYVEVADNDNLSFGNTTYDSPFSISAWINMTDATKFRIVNKRDSSKDEYQFTTSGSDTLGFNIFDLSTGGFISRKYNTALTSYEGQWIHVSATYDGSSSASGMKLYLNGTRVDDTTSTGGTYVAMENTNAPFNIGKQIGDFANGLIDEVAVFNAELSASDVSAISSAPTDLSSYSSLVSWWRFEGTGTTATDSGSGGNNGTLTNGVTRSSDVPT